MQLVVERKYKKADYTIGRLTASPQLHFALRQKPPLGEGAYFTCDTLEPPLGTPEEMRTAGSRKCIPPGTYKIRMAWSQKFQEQLPRVEEIPPKQGGLGGLGAVGGLGTRSHILIHAGNTVSDTAGCILVGRNLQVGRVLDSRKTLNMILALIKIAIKKEQVTITIK